MSPKMHKLFMTRCDLEEERRVSAADCERCSRGSVVDRRSRVLCAGQMKFFVTPCYFGMRAAATVHDCEDCRFGQVDADGLRVLCSR